MRKLMSMSIGRARGETYEAHPPVEDVRTGVEVL